ncbi:MAG: hypothetical protein KC442_20755 [Thermomicrobiales bacterium]|nr:hypothetical protein [Thermomicrobiales bacterium]MCA9880243.1 hypothetical protein [Thermomicrobiales bacterium]
MRRTRFRAANGQRRRWRAQPLGIAVLAVSVASAALAGSAVANPSTHIAGKSGHVHQAASPGSATPVSETLLSGCLIGSWLHSWEEDTPAMVTFRPADHDFGPSRGRDGYEFQTGGILVYHGFGPADAPLTSVGEWGWHAGDQIHLAVNDPQGVYIDEVLRIVSCDAELLQVERVGDSPA